MVCTANDSVAHRGALLILHLVVSRSLKKLLPISTCLQLSQPDPTEAFKYLQLLCLAERALPLTFDLWNIVVLHNHDLRRCINSLQLWLQGTDASDVLGCVKRRWFITHSCLCDCMAGLADISKLHGGVTALFLPTPSVSSISAFERIDLYERVVCQCTQEQILSFDSVWANMFQRVRSELFEIPPNFYDVGRKLAKVVELLVIECNPYVGESRKGKTFQTMPVKAKANVAD